LATLPSLVSPALQCGSPHRGHTSWWALWKEKTDTSKTASLLELWACAVYCYIETATALASRFLDARPGSTSWQEDLLLLSAPVFRHSFFVSVVFRTIIGSRSPPPSSSSSSSEEAPLQFLYSHHH